MNSQDNDQANTQPPVDELALLKDRATMMGIPFSGNIGLDTLKERIKNHLEGGAPKPSLTEAGPQSQAQVEQNMRDSLQKSKMKLVRCRIYNLDPKKNDLRGEIITVANKYLGTVRKFIPFGEATDNGYHIPQVIYDDLKRRKFQQIRTKKVKGNIEVEARMVPEYSLEIMPPLNEEELKELAINQQAAQRVGGE